MDSEVKMFFLIRRVFFCMGHVLTQLFCVTELNNLLHCAIDDWFVNDRLDMGLEIGGTGWDDGFPWCGGMVSGNHWLMGSVNSTSALSLSWQTACLRCADRWDFDRKSASHQAIVGRYIHGTWYCIAYESHTDGHSWRQKRQIVTDFNCRWVTDLLTARSRVRDQVYVTCCCEFFVRLGSCPLVWHMYGVYLLHWHVAYSSHSAEELDSRFVSEWETDYLLFFMKSSCIRCLESGLSKSAIVISRTSVNKFARLITKWTKACDKRLSRLISYIHHTCDVENNADWNCFKVPILQEILRIQILHQVEHCAFLEVTCLFQ